ncbi:ABC transporter ATP-binding protein [Salinibacterium sp. ZJ70]|uniref:ABC transporter ATP-binding protein n=1 Tax=Salinibacterium sp. ZJ70 TaxID=2708084 RepID=UPI001CD46D1A|nr:ABC transporter ATP-binding protein [Salinibacterium sp. ZJ70]
MNAATVYATGLRKSFGSFEALRGVELTVRPGTVFGLIGPNGSGKSTTLKILLDLLRPSAGEVRVLGESPLQGGARMRTRIGYLPGDLRLRGHSTGRRLLRFYAGVSGRVDDRYVEQLAERLGLDLDRRIGSLSKGNKQKLGLVQAFMHRPELLVLDEPTSGLDPLVQREFHRMLAEACAAGQTVLLSSHVLSEVQNAAHEVAVLSEGRVIAAGDVDALRLRSLRRVNAGIATSDRASTEAAIRRETALAQLRIEPDPVGLRLTGTSHGEIGPLVAALARFEIRDLALEEPDLEESVLHLYGEGGQDGRHA